MKLYPAEQVFHSILLYSQLGSSYFKQSGLKLQQGMPIND